MVGSSEDDDMKAAKAASLAAAGGGAVGRASQSSPRSRMTKRRQVTGGETTGDDYEDEEDEEEDDDDDSESAGSDEEAEDNRGRRRDEVKMEGTSAAAGAKAPGDSPGKHQHRREKRLAMNRESARARRKRKKLLIESLEGQVSSLTEQNSKLTATAEALVARVRQLESELAITASASRPAAAATSFMGPTGRDVSSLDSSLLGTLPPAQSSYLMLDPLRAQIRAEELHRARRSAAAGLGGYAFQGGGGFDAPLWETLPFRPQFLGNNPHLAGLAPTSMLAPSLRNTLASSLDFGIGPARLGDAYSSSLAASAAGGEMQPLPDARAASSVIAGSLSQPASSAQSLSELLKRQQQLQRRHEQQQRGGDSADAKLPPRFPPNL